MDANRRFRPHSLPLINTQVSPPSLVYHFLAKFRLKKKGWLEATASLAMLHCKLDCDDCAILGLISEQGEPITSYR